MESIFQNEATKKGCTVLHLYFLINIKKLHFKIFTKLNLVDICYVKCKKNVYFVQSL